ncbi:DUF4347 domain-containing protein [Pseudomonas sp. MN1F]|uniref:DUF4347 domain-containing protein n=1 Tax=Pseudomonas sp. MN1F TaxID=1366632 RepID=UPI00128F78AA|nr:DUF4347 domain-containing protein [Pseudomonas sp. MN1F]MQG95527.1 DUF4347 domain-containing protein [Pseudomonas sp. MN1F]
MKFIERFSRQPAKQAQPVDPGAAPLLMALEPRIMFDASVGVVAQDAAQATSEPSADSTSKESVAKDTASAAASADTRSTQGTQSSQASQRQEVVFVDGQVGNVQQLLAGLSSNAEIVVLDPTKDGLQQMADYLQGRQGIDAVHLLSHGADGTVQVGNTWLASSNLAEHRAALESIGAALKADGDLMIYGCRVGDSSTGQAFIDQLAAITGADVAASADDTGAALLGGNWTLERNSGAIETTALAVDNYEGVLVASWSTGSSPLGGTIAAAGRTVVGDFDGDGDTDILYQTGGNGSAWSYARSNGDGTFTLQTQAQSPFAGLTLLDHSGTNYYVGDFDGDGDVDILTGVNATTGTFLRNDAGTFFQASSANFPAPLGGTRMVVGDFDNDGDTDILYQTGGNGTAWAYARSEGGGNFTQLTLANSPFAGLSLPDNVGNNYYVADFDGDGDLDILAAASGSTGTYLRNNGNGTFSSLSTATFPSPAANGRMLVGDFDGDGNADILYQTGANGTAFQFAKSNGDGTFTIMSLASSPLAGLSLIDHTGTNYRVGDFDGDGDLDIFSAAAGTTGNLYLQNGAAPELVSTSPSDNATGVSTTANITLTFSESVTKGSTGNIYIIRTSDNTVVETIAIGSGQISGSGTTWTIDPSIVLAGGVAYAVRVDPKTFVDSTGTVFKGINNPTTLNFTTVVAQPPVLSNVNGDAVTYAEDAAYVLLDSGSNATVTDADSANFSGGKMTVQITTGLASGEDVLFIRDQGNGANLIFVSGASIIYNGLVVGTFTGGSNGNPLVITFTSNANPTTVSALVQNLAYRNANSSEPSTTARSVSISMDDGAGGSSTTSVVSLSVQAVNDAPVVNITATNPTYTENTAAVQLFSGATINTVESGQSVLQMVFTVTGVANGAAEKLVIDGTDVTLVQGTSVTTSINGISVSVSVSAGTATVTLDKAGGLSTATAQTVLNSLSYRNDSESPTTVNRVVSLSTVSDNGGSSNGGQATAAVGIFSTVTVVGINDAPVLSGGPYNFATINEDTTATGVRISTVLANHTMVDPDVGALRGVAIIAKTGSGTWQYSTDNSNWTDFGAVSSSSALLIASTTYIRYVPDAANGETATLSFRGWDQTTGTASVNGIRGLADTTSNGGTSAFSTGTGTVNQVVTSVNDAPIMIGVAPTLPGLTDTSTSSAGTLVSDLLGGVTDVDTGALKGMAITGLTSTYGKWQYSTNAGGTWSDVGTVSATSALILTAQNLVRFVPDGIHGETATITYKAWDQTNATLGLQGTKTNTSASGGTSAYSSQVDTATVVVSAVNDRPVVTVTGTAAIWTEGNNVVSDRIVVDSGVTLSDPDGPNPTSATVRLLTYYSAQDSLAFVNDGLSMGNIVGTWNAGTGILTLTSADNSATAAQFQAAMRAVTYGNASDTPNTTSRTVQFQVTDGDGLSSIAVTRDITLVAVNDSPTISAPASQQIIEDVPAALGSITFNDVDSTLGIVTFTVASGTLSATGAGGVTVGGTATALTLSGTLANINQFIANNRLVYTAAANASGDVTLTINVNTTSVSDATTTMTLQVQAVNDAPVASVPPSITVTEDVSSVITGISFTDVDAGSNTVTATFSVPSGTLSATSGMGVSVVGSGSGLLTLSGSLANINVFIAANSLTFKTAQDATASVTLTVSINDRGASGSGGEQTDTRTVTLNVTAVNDAPVNNVPGSQTASQNVVLGFNTANGNAISISDVDAGNGLMTVTLTATNGLLSLGSLSGISLVTGTGLNNITMTFEGTRSNINAALQTLTFRPSNNFLGAASVTIETNDNGNSGTGGAKSDVDIISINVIPVNPKVINVSAQGLDRTVKVGDEVLISMTWDQVVNVDLSSGRPTLLLETGLVDRNAQYVSGSGSNTLVFKYTVQAGDISADLDFQSTAALQMNGAVISNNTSDLAVLTLPTIGGADSLGGRSNIVVDGVVPVVGSVSAPVDGTYIIGQDLDFTVNFSEAMTVDTSTGVPRIAVTLDTGGTVWAEYVSGSGSSALVFRMVVTSGQLDSNGITLGSSIDTNGGAITDLAGNATVTTLNGVASTAGVNVDGIAPSVASVTPPADGSYKPGDVLTFTVNASEAVQIGSLAPRLTLDVGGVTRYASYVSGSGTDRLVFQYVVLSGDNDANGIAVSSLDLRGDQLTDLAGNAIDPALGNGNLPGVLVDTTAPIASNIVRVGASPSNSSSASFTVTFSEDVSGVDVSDFTLALGGSAAGSIASVTRVDGRTYTVLVDNLAGIGSVQLNLNASGTGIADAAGNALVGGLSGASYSIDRVAPSVTHVDVPNGGTYVAGQNLDFTVHMDEAVLLDTSNGSPRLEVTLDNGQTAYATYLSGAGSSALVFRLTVATGQLDTTGIAIGSAIQLNGATLRDAIGNDAHTALNGLPNTGAILVDAVAPTVSSLDLPASGAYKAGDVLRFTVNASEVVNVNGTPRLALNIGGVTRYADYVSGSGSSALVFEYTIVSPNTANSGIGLPGSIDLNGATLRDPAGNAMNLNLNAPGSASGVIVDTQAPEIANIARVEVTPTHAGSVHYTVTFNENVSGVDSADFSLAFTGSANGRIASITRIDGRTYEVLVDNLAGAGNVRLDLNGSNTGIVDVAGNPVSGGLAGSVYSIDRVAPSVTSVGVPASGTYTAGQTLDFTVNTDEAVLVDSSTGNPRLAVTLDNGRVVYADYLAGSGSTALTFRLTVTNGMAGNSTFAVASSIDSNGGTLRDAIGNDANTGLHNVGNTRGILVDARAPQPSSIVVEGPVLPTDRSLSFTLTFDEAVSGVDANDFSVLGTASASGVVQSVQRIDAQTYRIVVGDLRGQGTLSLSLNALNSGIQDGAGNLLVQSLASAAQAQQTQDVGDLEYRINPPDTSLVIQPSVIQPQVPGIVINQSLSPLVPGPLFDVRTVGADLKPLGTIFLGQAGSAPSFIAQVFGSSDSGLGGGDGQGFLGFGGGNGGVFGASTFATLFGREVPGVTELNVFSAGQWKQSELNQGLRGVFGVPTFGQQLQQINEADQRQVRELAKALAKPAEIGQRA